ncbi:hypothetical protein [Aerobium aerolatum]|uniref:Uncharacterized protein n=1 Tax=Aquamicrobium aerolatum DSM 21857 TaxID=1121003 RepID=A0A1I3SUA1_9HYPH|nr:hypothetical protein [Aquamicrobium aerolatum]SFJ61429.1 hypothetical protein SAMN03080618_03456 [Aquamicrobium aerolatum DSM 21857]
MANEDIKFWSDPSRWPRDTNDYVFICQAVLIVGKAIFGDEWTGDEPITPPPFYFWTGAPNGLRPLVQSEASQQQKVQMHRLLMTHSPQFKREPIRYGRWGPPSIQFRHEECSAGLQIANDIDASHALRRDRFTRAQWFLVSALSEGHLASRLRPIRGGAFSDDLPSSIWNGEDFSARFFWGQMNPSSPFGVGVGGDRHQYIFVSREQLTALLKIDGKPTDPSPQSEGPILQPDAFSRFDSIVMDQDPMGMSQWSLGIAMLWITYRSAERMRMRVGNLDMLLVSDGAGTPREVTAARRDLLNAMQDGRVVATATPISGINDGRVFRERHRETSATEWKPLDSQRIWTLQDRDGMRHLVWLGGDQYFDDVRVNRASVMNEWPAIGQADAAKNELDPQDHLPSEPPFPILLPGSVPAMRRTVKAAQRFMRDHGFQTLTKAEAEEQILKVLHAGTQVLRREVVSEISSDGKRRPQASLANRDKELADCREFLTNDDQRD